MSELTDRMESDVPGVFLRASDFSTEAAFIFGAVSNVFNVLFDENYTERDAYGNPVSNSMPVAFCATADIENDAGKVPGENSDDATLEIDGVIYNVIKCARGGDTSMLSLSRD